jgi:hypothetical protein
MVIVEGAKVPAYRLPIVSLGIEFLTYKGQTRNLSLQPRDLFSTEFYLHST